MEIDNMELDTPPPNTKTRPFVRAQLPPLPVSGDGAQDTRPPCIVCKNHHPIGRCPLKLAGVEHCPLCGLAHFGKNRNCPHLHSEVQIRHMISALQRSNEPPEQVAKAKRYLYGIVGDLNKRARKKAFLEAGRLPQPSQMAPPRTTSSIHYQSSVETQVPESNSETHQIRPTFPDESYRQSQPSYPSQPHSLPSTHAPNFQH